MAEQKRAWWKEAVVYQIYPRSFQDSDGDGIGDLNGIRSRLGYIAELGADVIWLCPIYRSPNDDNGYDISDYRSIMSEFGTLEDFQRLLEEAHGMGLKIILDLAVNHTSDEHPWFAESRSNPDSDKRDYYIWREGRDGAPPNNWGSYFSGSAWNLDENTGMYYLHLFSPKQPDLNWENPQVRREVHDLMRWWLDKGLDGFRLDVINLISKVPELPDGPVRNGLYGDVEALTANGPRIHEYLKEMHREVFSRYDIFTVGETPGVTVEDAKRYTGGGELNMVFQFEHMELTNGELGKWTDKPVPLVELKKSLARWQKGLDGCGWNSLYWNNHDRPRAVSRFGDDSTEKYRVLSAKMLATCLHMMQGTPYIYQGEELGMTNVRFQSLTDYRDLETLNAYRELVEAGKVTPEFMMRCIYTVGRDNARTPMQWRGDSPSAGFTQGTPWIKVNPNYPTVNAESQVGDPHSVFSYYQALLRLRREHDIVVYGGDFELLFPDSGSLFCYRRRLNNQSLLVFCHFGAGECPAVSLEELGAAPSRLLLSNYPVSDPAAPFTLRPYEARVYLGQ